MKGTGKRLAVGLVASLLFCFSMPLSAQSKTGSRAASELLVGGSEMMVAGSVELFQGGAGLVVTSAVQTGRTVKLVLGPVARGASATADFSKTVAVEISAEAWERVKASAHTGAAIAGELASVIGTAVETVALTASAAGVTASAAAASGVATSGLVLGYALVIEGVVIGVVPLAVLDSLLGHRVHSHHPSSLLH